MRGLGAQGRFYPITPSLCHDPPIPPDGSLLTGGVTFRVLSHWQLGVWGVLKQWLREERISWHGGEKMGEEGSGNALEHDDFMVKGPTLGVLLKGKLKQVGEKAGPEIIHLGKHPKII